MLETLAEEYPEATPYIRRAIDEHGESWVLEHYYEQLYPLGQVMAMPEKADLPFYDELVENFTTGYPLLDPTREATGTRDSTYQLRLNVNPESFLPGDFS